MKVDIFSLCESQIDDVCAFLVSSDRLESRNQGVSPNELADLNKPIKREFDDKQPNEETGSVFCNEQTSNEARPLISISDLLTNKMAKVYEVNGSTYVEEDGLSSHNDDTLARYELFKVLENVDDDDDDDDDDDEDMTADLDMSIQTLPQGLIINGTVFLRTVQWHTFTPIKDELCSCAVCSTFIHNSDFEEHIKTTSHLQNLDKYKPLSRFDLSIIRMINENLHCGVCNQLFDLMDYITHENSKSHEGNLLTAINKVSDLMYDSNVHLNHYTNNKSLTSDRNVQSFDRNMQRMDRNIQRSDRNSQSTDRNSRNTDRNSESVERYYIPDRNRLNSDRNSQSSDRQTAEWGRSDIESIWQVTDNPTLNRNIERLVRSNVNMDREFPSLNRNNSIDREFPSLDRNTPTPDRNKKEMAFANSVNNNNISVYEDYSDDESNGSEEYCTLFQGVSYASMASKPSMQMPKFLKIDLGTKEVRVKFESWHMLVQTDLNQFHCMVCNKREHIRHKWKHCAQCEHVEGLAKCAVVSAFEDYLIRQIDDKLYHCGHCNNLQYQNQMLDHIESAHPKKNKNLTDESTKTKKQSDKNKSEKNTSTKAKSEIEKSAILNKSLEYKAEKKIETVLNIFGDVKLSPFGSELTVSALSLNVVVEKDGGYYCAICDVVCEDVKVHVEDLDHVEQMNITPFIRPFKNNLTRAIRGTLHCGLCNKLVLVNQILEHNMDPPHTNALAVALGMKKTQLPSNDTKIEYLQANISSDLNKRSVELNKPSTELNKPSISLNNPSLELNKTEADLNTPKVDLNTTVNFNEPSNAFIKAIELKKASGGLDKAINELNKLSTGLNKPSNGLNKPNDQKVGSPTNKLFTNRNIQNTMNPLKSPPLNGNVLNISKGDSHITTPLPSPNSLIEKSTPKKVAPTQNGYPGQNMGHNLKHPLPEHNFVGQNVYPLANVFPGQNMLPPQNIQYPYPLLKDNVNSQILGAPLHYNVNIPIPFGLPFNNMGYLNTQNVANNTNNPHLNTNHIKSIKDNIKPGKDNIKPVKETILSVSNTIRSVKDNIQFGNDKSKPVSDIIQSVYDNVHLDNDNVHLDNDNVGRSDKSDEDDIKIFDEEEEIFVKMKTAYFKITNLSYNTLVYCDGVKHFCFVCSSSIRVSMLQKHVDNREHIDNLAKNKFLEKYGLQLFRQMYLMYHCAICNVLMTRKEIKLHLDWPEHNECYEVSRKIFNKKTRKELKANHGIKEYVGETQKEALFHNVNEPKINVISAYRIVPTMDWKDTPESTPTKSKPTAAKRYKMVILNNSVMKVDFDHWHGISRAKNVIKCLICQEELRPREVLPHVETPYHCVALGKTFEKAYYPALIRKINELTVNCVICNLELTNLDSMIHEHILGRKHVKNQENIVNESSNSDSYADCYEDYLNL